MVVVQNGNIVRTYNISTAKNGLGEQKDSFKTPRGWHMIRAKIGAGHELGSVFSARRHTGEIYSKKLSKQHPDRDWILTRILWLSGLEKGINRLGNVDTMQRYVYIHGSPEERMVGKPASRGCICMTNEDIVDFFELVPYGTRVYIEDM